MLRGRTHVSASDPSLDRSCQKLRMAGRRNDASTIYFTPEEINRIRATASSALENASQLRGIPRQPRDATSSLRQATGASLMADMAGSSRTREALPVLTVGQPYPPCSVPTSDLRVMKLAELVMETHHRGRKLVLKRAAGVGGRGLGAVVQLAARSWAILQDVGGADEVERLEVCLHTHERGNDVLECSGTKTLVVREPYFTVTEQGEATLRVDHPSDLECLDEGEHFPSQKLEEGVENLGKAVQHARKCKEQGNTALTARDPSLAYTYYSRGLSLLTKSQAKDSSHPSDTQLEEITRDLHRNRAHTNLLLNRLDAAKTDALCSLAGARPTDPDSRALDSKAYYRAGCAAYNLGEYEEARALFSRRQHLTPGASGAAVRKTNQRIRERGDGEYDWPGIRAAAALYPRRQIDAASFGGDTRVGDSPGRGVGLFASCNVPRGGLVLCEKAFCVAWGNGENSSTAVTYDVRDGRVRVSPAGLVRAVVEKLRGTPSFIERVMGLYGDYRGIHEAHGKDMPAASCEDAVVDVFRVHDIVSRNAFGMGPSARDNSAGLWVRAARINHSCVPNTDKEFLGDMMLVRAKRPILTGEEILHSYIDETSGYKARQEALMTTWGFECDCSLCERQRREQAGD